MIIGDMDFIKKYTIKTILHQQEIQQLLNEKKLQTQEVQSNTVQALKVDSVVMENTCSGKDNSNSDTALSKSVKESSLDSATKDVHAIKYKMSKAKKRCMAYFRSLHSHLQVLSKEDLKGTRIEHGFKRAFMSLFGQDDDTFTSTIQMPDMYFAEYTGIEVKQFKETLLQHMRNVKKSVAERTRHQRHGTESGKQDDNNRSGNDTDVDDTDIRPIYNEEPMAEYTKKFQVKSPLLNSSPDNKTTEFSNQSLKSEYIFRKKTVAQFQKDFLRMEAHCVALELKYQNQALKSGQHGQILNETSNKAKIKKEIDAYETINIELEHSVAKLLIENEHLNKKNETVKKHYKDLYDSIKITRSKTIEQTTSLLANNADLKAQIQEKVFAIAALKNKLRKNQSVVRQPNAFKSERPQISKPRFASQTDVKNDLSKPVTQHYLPKTRESAFAKPDQVIASSKSRNSSKNMPRFSSNDMVHNYYLEEALKKTQERNRNSKSSVMHTASPQNTTKGIKPKPRSNNQTSRSLPVSKSSCVTITAVPKADHSKNSSSFSDSKHFVCSTCQKFSPNKTSVVYEKTSPRSDLRWKPTGRIFKTVGLRWVPIGKILASCTSKDDSESTHGSDVEIFNIHECKQTLDSVVAEKANISETSVEVDLKLIRKMTFEQQDVPTSNMIVMTSMAELESLFGPLFDEYFNGENLVVSKSSAVTTADASDKRQQQPYSTSSTSTLATTVTANGNFDL
ncbi:hypothetical protein Tco_0299004 [Tanacetum coccineum]